MTTTPPCARGVVVYRWTSCTPSPAVAARAVLRRVLARLHLPEDTVSDCVLAASELVANATEHACGPYELRLRRTRAEYICEVRDGDSEIPDLPAFPATSPFAPVEAARGGGLDALCALLSERGRGLQIVNELARGAWGMRSDSPNGKFVWFAFSAQANRSSRPSSTIE
ncbi:ATP-binding protein [Streptomyces sp. TRM66268-LWL]|uniref:ATP-binding protein n=1 Tax=Streptomyces polyasparticus TaxID=2767826 RepID=A0ABR7SSR1_9ACTN|nr:ATP-binding protein [Streptomyces polyasparticus]MBC9718007.1 ATP-binding protein [Streptomyces polyasparticus]